MSSTAYIMGVVVFCSIIGIAVGEAVYRRRSQRSKTDTGPRRERLQRDASWVTVLSEHDEGYGLAIQNVDGGAELCAFRPDDEIYASVWVGPEELSTVADGFSVRACTSMDGGAR